MPKHQTSSTILENLKKNDPRFKDMVITKRALKIPTSKKVIKKIINKEENIES